MSFDCEIGFGHFEVSITNFGGFGLFCSRQIV